MARTVGWTVPATTMRPATDSPVAASVVRATMVATVSWSALLGSMGHTAPISVSVRMVPPATPRQASAVVLQDIQGTPVVTPALQGCLAFTVERSVSVGLTHVTGEQESASAHPALEERTVPCHVGQEGMGPDVSRCASVCKVAGVSPPQASVPACQAGLAQPAATKMFPSSLRVTSGAELTFP